MHSTVSAYRPDRLCHAQCSNYIAATHNITHSLCTLKCTTHPPLLTPLPSTTLLCIQLINTKHICVSGSKMVEDVGIVCKCCGVISILVGWFWRFHTHMRLFSWRKTFLCLHPLPSTPQLGNRGQLSITNIHPLIMILASTVKLFQNLKYWKFLKGKL